MFVLLFVVPQAIIRLSGRLSHNGGEQPSINLLIIGVVLFHVPLRATSYATSIQLKIAADYSQQANCCFILLLLLFYHKQSHLKCDEFRPNTSAYVIYIWISRCTIGTTRPIPPNRRSCLGCIWWNDMSNPKRLRWNIVLTETYESRSAITNQSEHLEQRAIGTTRPIPPNRRSCKV